MERVFYQVRLTGLYSCPYGFTEERLTTEIASGGVAKSIFRFIATYARIISVADVKRRLK
jgi:hypothetical protein